jgi:TH1 protein
MISPPYSMQFVQSLLHVVGSPSITEALKSVESRELIKEFIAHCTSAGTFFHPFFSSLFTSLPLFLYITFHKALITHNLTQDWVFLKNHFYQFLYSLCGFFLVWFVFFWCSH